MRSSPDAGGLPLLRAARARRASPNHPRSRPAAPPPGCSTRDALIAVPNFALCRVASGALWCRRCSDSTSTCRVRGHRASPSSPPSSICPSCRSSSWSPRSSRRGLKADLGASAVARATGARAVALRNLNVAPVFDGDGATRSICPPYLLSKTVVDYQYALDFFAVSTPQTPS